MIHYDIYNNKGNLIDKTTPEETEFIVVSVFGNAEIIDSFDKNDVRIWRTEPKQIDSENYKGSYQVFRDEFDDWAKMLNEVKTAQERRTKWIEIYGGN